MEVSPFGRISLPVLPFRFSNAAVEIDPKCAVIGEDNHKVLARYLNYPPEKVDGLLRVGVLYEHELATQRRRTARPRV
jgi:crotonobetainyl-CoA:carnitine CoA-transferase CaiB-like acyl-CoA transferase